MTDHEHEALRSARYDNGTVIEVCECGATRITLRDQQALPWHTCELCTHPWGLPKRQES
jgi:hypothetical protein